MTHSTTHSLGLKSEMWHATHRFQQPAPGCHEACRITVYIETLQCRYIGKIPAHRQTSDISADIRIVILHISITISILFY